MAAARTVCLSEADVGENERTDKLGLWARALGVGSKLTLGTPSPDHRVLSLSCKTKGGSGASACRFELHVDGPFVNQNPPETGLQRCCEALCVLAAAMMATELGRSFPDGACARRF